MTEEETAVLRARDFWASLVLIALSLFFLWRTSFIPLWGDNRAGVRGADWYNSAALVPLGVFGAMLVLSLALLFIAIRAGGAARALSAAGVGWNRSEAHRFASLALIFLSYIAGLVPRVDFILASGLLITALIWGYHGGHTHRMWRAALAVGAAGLYATVRHLPRAEWSAWDDDALTLGLWAGLTAWALWGGRRERALRTVPILALGAPLILICAMAFGFRQNVPNRGGLIFTQIEYHYYVTLRPLWRP